MRCRVRTGRKIDVEFVLGPETAVAGSSENCETYGSDVPLVGGCERSAGCVAELITEYPPGIGNEKFSSVFRKALAVPLYVPAVVDVSNSNTR